MMTPRERWLAALRMQQVDHLPFWPKIGDSYPRAQRAPFNTQSIDELHDWIGSDRHEYILNELTEIRTTTDFEVVTEDNLQQRYYRTPHGTLTEQWQWDDGSQSWCPIEFPVKCAADVAILTEWFNDIRVEVDADKHAQALTRAAEIGEQAVTYDAIGESPLMLFVEWLAGIDQAHYLLCDAQDEVEALFDAIHRVLLRKAELLAEYSPADLLYLIENTSTTLISPQQYRTYCLPHLTAYADILHTRDRLLGLHMCGHLKALLPDIATIDAEVFEAFTSPTLGDTTLLDGRTHCPDTCLVGGTNAMLWTRPAAEIIETLEYDLDQLPHHRGLVITSGGVMTPLCAPETIKTVCDWVQAYPARM